MNANAQAAWYDDLDYLVPFARWLYYNGELSRGGDWLAFFDDPVSWLLEAGGDLRAEYEKEMTA